LQEWQQQFSYSLLNNLQPVLSDSFRAKSEVSRNQRFSIYQNNVFYSLTSALSELYPVVKKLVSDDFFTGTASYYLRSHPPQQAAMVHFGQDFPRFLSAFEHTKPMPYLAEVARLELARHRAYHAHDQTSIKPEVFNQINPEQLAETRVRLHPSLHMVESDQPVFTIWQANQSGGEQAETIQLGEPQQVLVVRAMYDVVMYAVDQGTYYFVQQLQLGQTIQQAITTTIEQKGEFNISSAIQLLIQEQFITNIDKQGMAS
jgi:hypothetical protein